MIELRTIHIIEGKRVYCDVLTKYGIITIPFDMLQSKAKLNEVSNCVYKLNKLTISKDVDSVIHEYAINIYHISFDKPDTIYKAFNPRIPYSAAGMEDKSIPRVCFSDSIGGAISGIPDGVDMISDENIIDTEYYNDTIYVGCITVGNNDSRLISYSQLYKSDLVFDALSTHEYWWITNSILLEFKKYSVESIKETFHYIVSDSNKEEIAQEFENISIDIANKIRSLCGEALYYYINTILVENKLTEDKIGRIMFSLGIDDISIVKEVIGQYIK